MRYFLCFFLLASFSLNGQNHLTPYDLVPGVITAHKPAYSSDYPEWGKMLFDYPVNFNALTKAYASDHADGTNNHRPLRRYYKQWIRTISPFVQDRGEIELPDFSAYQHTLRHQKKELDLRSSAIGPWTFVGPKETFWLNASGSADAPTSCPWQVNIYSFDVATTNSDILFVGTETGFVNKTTDKGHNWEQVGLDYNFGGGVTAVVIDPRDERRVWVAAGNQIHRSEDSGKTWQALLTSGLGFQASRMEADHNNPGKLIAATNNGIAISLDGGNSWKTPWNETTYDIHILPGDAQKIYALSVVNGDYVIVVSNNGGQTFSVDPRFPGQIENGSGGLMAVTPDNPDLVRVLLLSKDNTPLLYEKAGGQPFWQLLNTGNTANFPLDNGQGYYDLAFEISPTNVDVIYAGTTTLYKSSDGGQSFIAIGGYRGNFPIHPDVQDLKILDDQNVWVATDGGMTHSVDNFENTANAFARINGIVGSDMWGFDQGWNEDIVVGGRYHNGNTAIADFYQPKALRMGGAESPTGWVLQGKSRHVAFDDLGNGWILPATAESQPEGRFIFSKYPNMDEYGGRRGNMVFHPNYYGTVFLGEGTSLWKSEDMGLSFDLIYDFGDKVRMIQVSIADPDVMYADVVSRGLQRSLDGGSTWEPMPALTDGSHGTSYWRGRTHFVVSPVDAMTLYACLSNGTWSKDQGAIFRSSDGGVTWENWTGSLQVYTKSLAIQPGSDGEDVIYLSANAENNTKANVYSRKSNDTDWEVMGSDFPAGFSFNTMIPFFRDSKLRVAGNGGVWENALVENDYEPILNPWTERRNYNCKLDTIFFDDHSIIDHTDCSWSWEIDPQPLYISDPNARNPRVVLGESGSYSVTMTLTKNGKVYAKTIHDMVSTTECPSLDNCDNPGYAEKSNWELLYFDSEEVNQPGRASMAFDGDLSTIWHTRWSTGTDPYPHEIQIDLGEKLLIHEFSQTPRQNGVNGRIKEYELFVSDDEFNWGGPVHSGSFQNSSAPQTIEFSDPPEGRYIRLLCLSEVNDGPWTSIAEIDVKACRPITTDQEEIATAGLHAFPVPTNDELIIEIPQECLKEYFICSLDGRILRRIKINESDTSTLRVDLSSSAPGHYTIVAKTKSGTIYRVQTIKE